jgi:hypothetical protein
LQYSVVIVSTAPEVMVSLEVMLTLVLSSDAVTYFSRPDVVLAQQPRKTSRMGAFWGFG